MTVIQLGAMMWLYSGIHLIFLNDFVVLLLTLSNIRICFKSNSNNLTEIKFRSNILRPYWSIEWISKPINERNVLSNKINQRSSKQISKIQKSYGHMLRPDWWPQFKRVIKIYRIPHSNDFHWRYLISIPVL